MEISIVSIVIFTLIVSIQLSLCQKKEGSLKPETSYASSLFRKNRKLEGVPEIANYTNVISLSMCLAACMKQKPDCKAFNYGNRECTLLIDSVCANDTLELTPIHGYSYYDIMDSQDYEKKHLRDKYCRKFGKCSGRCYPRKPVYIDTPMKKVDAIKHCMDLERTLPQPRSNEENAFFGNFIKSLLKERPEIRNHKDMKYWIGLTDVEIEGEWMYDDGTPLLSSFTAWATGQPDNGGSFGGAKENCAALGESGDFKWFDVNCNTKYKFFC